MNDGKLVYVKRVATGDTESQIIMKFSSPASRLDPRNHCVPVLDYFTDDEDSSISYIVMPFLRPVEYPPLETINDVAVFVSQLMEVCKQLPMTMGDYVLMILFELYRALFLCTSKELPIGT